MLLAAGCSRKELQQDAGAGVIGFDAGPSDVAVPADAAWDVPFMGLRSYSISSTLQLEGGTTSHGFTLVLDSDRRLVITGDRGRGNASPVEQTTDGFRIVGPLLISEPMIPGIIIDDLRTE